jgi:hypothetical protein
MMAIDSQLEYFFEETSDSAPIGVRDRGPACGFGKNAER